jgi:hypothetical protein
VRRWYSDANTNPDANANTYSDTVAGAERAEQSLCDGCINDADQLVVGG